MLAILRANKDRIQSLDVLPNVEEVMDDLQNVVEFYVGPARKEGFTVDDLVPIFKVGSFIRTFELSVIADQVLHHEQLENSIVL